jgi:hypothetical protein
MAKALKPTTVADSKPPPSTADDWMPLIAAFLHIQQVVGGEELAEEELRQRIASADVEVQDRRVSPGVGIDIIPLKPEDCVGPYGLLFPRIPENISDLHREAHRRDNLLRRVERLRFDGHNFFLRRAVVYRIWPTAGGAEKPPPATLQSMPLDEPPLKQLPTKRPAGIGPRVWPVAHEVLALTQEGGKDAKWIHLNALLDTIRKRIGSNELSKRTLVSALKLLREYDLIDR